MVVVFATVAKSTTAAKMQAGDKFLISTTHINGPIVSLPTMAPLPSEVATTYKVLRAFKPEIQGHNLALTVLHVPYSFDSSGRRGVACPPVAIKP